MKIVYSRKARADLLDIWLWLANKAGTAIADGVLDRLEQRIAALEHHPQMGPSRTEIDRNARVLIMERWIILYAIYDGDVRIVRIIDGASDLSRLTWDD